ncbi:MAG: hypothetical protein MZW92_13755 [Comamonadaceae bacterium]|nr:hypothetical protein [Comamonadaceae bacterium]
MVSASGTGDHLAESTTCPARITHPGGNYSALRIRTGPRTVSAGRERWRRCRPRRSTRQAGCYERVTHIRQSRATRQLHRRRRAARCRADAPVPVRHRRPVYLLEDHLGGVDGFTSSSRRAADAHLLPAVRRAPLRRRARRRADVQLSGSRSRPTTSRGYTGHEHLDNLGLVHMNGRVYDPVLGRFLEPRPDRAGAVRHPGTRTATRTCATTRCATRTRRDSASTATRREIGRRTSAWKPSWFNRSG